MLFGKHLNRYYLRYAPWLLLGLLSLFVVDYMQLRVPELYRIVVNGMNGIPFIENDTSIPFDMDFLLDRICLPMIIIILSMVAGRFLWRICFFGSGIRVECALRERMFDRAKDLSQQFYQTHKVGDMMALFTNDLETVQDCFGSGILMTADASLLGIMALVKMLRMHFALTLLCLIPMALLLAVSAVVGHYLEKKWDDRQAAFSALSDFAQENFSGIAVVKAFVKETVELCRFRKLNRQNEEANVTFVRLSTILRILVTLFAESVTCVILGYGGSLVHRGVFNVGELIEFIGYFSSIVWPIMAVSELIEMHSRGKASLKRIGKLLDAKPDVADAPTVSEPEPLRGNIEFRHLTFRYPDGEYDVLRDVSFTIRAGENVGIVGKTGSGKTTVVDLLLRTYNVPDGTIFLDGLDINRIPIRTVRRYASYVPQDNFLFSESILSNIAFASDTDDPVLAESAAKMSDVHDDIVSFSEGYGTVLGERGVTVSGGQKQRISIARALMKDAPILILDDAVSAVDVRTEKIILENLRRTREGKTTVFIAHRISTVENLDKIIVIDDGAVLAVGSHERLLHSCPAYRTMVELQQLSEQSEQADESAACPAGQEA
jgi:ATP-binding cassette, subfamily B, multidrug efflux pump